VTSQAGFDAALRSWLIEGATATAAGGFGLVRDAAAGLAADAGRDPARVLAAVVEAATAVLGRVTPQEPQLDRMFEAAWGYARRFDHHPVLELLPPLLEAVRLDDDHHTEIELGQVALAAFLLAVMAVLAAYITVVPEGRRRLSAA
jgi:hypothetical protein